MTFKSQEPVCAPYVRQRQRLLTAPQLAVSSLPAWQGPLSPTGWKGNTQACPMPCVPWYILTLTCMNTHRWIHNTYTYSTQHTHTRTAYSSHTRTQLKRILPLLNTHRLFILSFTEQYTVRRNNYSHSISNIVRVSSHLETV